MGDGAVEQATRRGGARRAAAAITGW